MLPKERISFSSRRSRSLKQSDWWLVAGDETNRLGDWETSNSCISISSEARNLCHSLVAVDVWKPKMGSLPPLTFGHRPMYAPRFFLLMRRNTSLKEGMSSQ